ncbi:MAG TPA: tRNA pseudouridine(38-40) synthase TruA [Chitinivibrionales bacterium]|jgi:tRNA pseudouridine38-40 synthase|nr:tRNA pseudouridine(38-40) synthase TruA [Chitinivibrionales bacterium]
MRYFFRVEYDGTRYGGWQSQENAPSVQDALNAAFTTVVRSECRVTGAGRTDAGVHAAGQGAHVDIDGTLDAGRCERSVNAVLDDDICVYGLRPAAPDFHARYSAVARRYKYFMARRKRPLLYKRVWMVFHDVDWAKVRANIPALAGTHDFSAFCATGTSTENMVCTVSGASLDDRDDLRVFTITADRFIYKMVRSIVGTLVDIGRGRLAATMREIIESKDRKAVGETAPACGLVLDYVEYPGIGNKE